MNTMQLHQVCQKCKAKFQGASNLCSACTPANMEVANTIVEQLGGRKFIAMTGARHFVGTEDSVSFHLPGGGGFCKNDLNYVTVTLDPSDTYTVVFSRRLIRQGAPHTIFHSIRHDIYADSLREVFTSETGLAVSL